jgi:CHAT domain-containing protein/tetratricopeptide (TPR) repeat protein
MLRLIVVAFAGLVVSPAAAQVDVAALDKKARALENQGQTDAAVKLFAQAVAGPDNTATGDLLDRYVSLLFRTGRYAEAVPQAERLLKLRTAKSGDAIAAAGARNQLALAYKLTGRVRDAIPLYEGTLAAFQKNKDLANSPVTATVMHNLAAAYATAGRAADAEKLYQAGLALAEKAPNGDKFLPQGWHNLATLYLGEDRFAEAATLFRKALAAKEKSLGPDDPTVAVTLNNLAGVLLEDGDAEGAEKLLLRAVAIFKNGKYENHPHAIISRNMLAEVNRSLGRLAEAEKLARESLAQLERSLGTADNSRSAVETAGCLVRLASVLKDQVKNKDAEVAARRAVSLREKFLEPGHPDTTAAWTLLASVLRASGKLDDAEKLLRKAKVATDARFGKAHPKSAEARRELAVCVTEQGRFAEAQALVADARNILMDNKKSDPFAIHRLNHTNAELNRQMNLPGAGLMYDAALRAAAAKFDIDHPLTTSWAYDAALNKVAEGKYADAEVLLNASLAGREKTLGPTHPATIATLELLSEVKESLRRSAEAVALIHKALDRTTDPMVTVRLASNLALRSVWAGDAKAGLAHAKRAVAAVEKVEALYPFDDPMCWLARHNAGYVAAAAGDVRESVAEFDAARRAVRRFLAEALPGLSEREQLFVLEKFDRFNLHAALTLGLTSSDASVATRTAEWLLNGKAVANEALAAVTRRTVDSSPVRATLNLRRQSAGFAITPPAEGRKRPADPWVNLSTVQAALTDGAVLIDIIRLDPQRPVPGKIPAKQPARYVAWVTGKAGPSKVIDLGSAAAIDAAVATARKAIIDGPNQIRSDGEQAAEKQLRAAAGELTKLVLDPLKPAVGSATVWHVSPDGELWLYPWAALPTADGKYLTEAVDVRYVTSGRDLVTRPSAPTSGGAVIVADPDFDAGTGKPRAMVAVPTGGRSILTLIGRAARLPGTAVEAAAVAPKLAALAGRQPTTLTGDQATYQHLRAAGRPKVLMLATHGFFLPPDPANRAKDKNWFESLTLPLTAGDEAVNPLRRSGLLLAGCNREPEIGGDTGVLTGLDVLRLDLRGCELVVLSACETGLGEVHDGEGVGGLRQAFLAAGAQRVMSTLWQVPDLESARLMTRCFELQAEGQPAGAALREAQKEAVERRREKNAAAHPFFWAAYTLTGRS